MFNVEGTILLHSAFACLELVARSVGCRLVFCCPLQVQAGALMPTLLLVCWLLQDLQCRLVFSTTVAAGWCQRDRATPHFISLPVTISPDSLFQSHNLHLHHHHFLATLVALHFTSVVWWVAWSVVVSNYRRFEACELVFFMIHNLREAMGSYPIQVGYMT